MNSHQDSHNASPAKKKMKPWLIALIFLGTLPFIAIFLAIATPWISYKIEQSRRSTCEERLTEIGEALLAYQKDHKVFPPAYTTDEQGKPLHSWRTLILPYLGHEDLLAKVDLTKPWDDPANQQVASESVSVYECGSAELDQGMTTYVAVIDPQGIMPGILPTQPRQILDGLAMTLIAVETDASNAVHWMSPQDITYATYVQADLNPEITNSHFGGHHILLADGSVMFLVEGSPPDLKTSFITMSGRDDPLAVMFGPEQGLGSPFTSSQPSAGSSVLNAQYEVGIQLLREITPANRQQKLVPAMAALERAATRGNADAARQLANLSQTQAEQYAWFAVAAHNRSNLRSPFQAFQSLLSNTLSHDALAKQYLQKYGRGSPSGSADANILTNGADEYVKKGDAGLARGYEGERLLSTMRKWYEMALERRQDYAPALRGLGELEGRLGNIGKATDYYRRALAQDPNSVRILNSFAWTLATRSDSETDRKFIDEAVEAAEKAYEETPADPSIQNTLGVCYYRAGRWDKALQKLNESVKGGADIVHNWLFISMANWRLGQKDEAREFLTKAVLWKQGKSHDAELKKFFAEAEQLIGPIDGLAEKIAARTARPTLPTVRQSPRKKLSDFETSIYEIEVDGSSLRKLTSVDGYRFHGLPFFSPNGEKLSWFARDKTTSKPSLFIGELDGTVSNQINDLYEGLWLDDQTLLVFEDGNLVKISANNEVSKTTLVPGVRPTLSINRRFLAYEKENNLFVRNLESGEEKAVLVNPPARTFNRFSISNDGERIAYVGNGQARGVYVSDLTTGDSQFIADEAGAEYWPKFSPDGKQVLFTAGDFGVGVGSHLNRIYVANISEKTSRPLTPEDYHCRDASWSPDGKSIAFVAVKKSVVDAELQSPVAPPTARGNRPAPPSTSEAIVLQNREITGDDLTRLARSSGLHSLNLSGTSITDAQIEQLNGIPSL